MLDFFAGCAREGKVVFVCLHPNEPYHVELLREVCERFVFVNRGRLTHGDIARGARRRGPFRATLGALIHGQVELTPNRL
jgi:hypothetical protein